MPPLRGSQSQLAQDSLQGFSTSSSSTALAPIVVAPPTKRGLPAPGPPPAPVVAAGFVVLPGEPLGKDEPLSDHYLDLVARPAPPCTRTRERQRGAELPEWQRGAHGERVLMLVKEEDLLPVGHRLPSPPKRRKQGQGREEEGTALEEEALQVRREDPFGAEWSDENLSEDALLARAAALGVAGRVPVGNLGDPVFQQLIADELYAQMRRAGLNPFEALAHLEKVLAEAGHSPADVQAAIMNLQEMMVKIAKFEMQQDDALMEKVCVNLAEMSEAVARGRLIADDFLNKTATGTYKGTCQGIEDGYVPAACAASQGEALANLVEVTEGLSQVQNSMKAFQRFNIQVDVLGEEEEEDEVDIETSKVEAEEMFETYRENNYKKASILAMDYQRATKRFSMLRSETKSMQQAAEQHRLRRKKIELDTLHAKHRAAVLRQRLVQLKAEVQASTLEHANLRTEMEKAAQELTISCESQRKVLNNLALQAKELRTQLEERLIVAMARERVRDMNIVAELARRRREKAENELRAAESRLREALEILEAERAAHHAAKTYAQLTAQEKAARVDLKALTRTLDSGLRNLEKVQDRLQDTLRWHKRHGQAWATQDAKDMGLLALPMFILRMHRLALRRRVRRSAHAAARAARLPRAASAPRLQLSSPGGVGEEDDEDRMSREEFPSTPALMLRLQRPAAATSGPSGVWRSAIVRSVSQDPVRPLLTWAARSRVDLPCLQRPGGPDWQRFSRMWEGLHSEFRRLLTDDGSSSLPLPASWGMVTMPRLGGMFADGMRGTAALQRLAATMRQVEGQAQIARQSLAAAAAYVGSSEYGEVQAQTLEKLDIQLARSAMHLETGLAAMSERLQLAAAVASVLVDLEQRGTELDARMCGIADEVEDIDLTTRLQEDAGRPSLHVVKERQHNAKARVALLISEVAVLLSEGRSLLLEPQGAVAALVQAPPLCTPQLLSAPAALCEASNTALQACVESARQAVEEEEATQRRLASERMAEQAAEQAAARAKAIADAEAQNEAASRAKALAAMKQTFDQSRLVVEGEASVNMNQVMAGLRAKASWMGKRAYRSSQAMREEQGAHFVEDEDEEEGSASFGPEGDDGEGEPSEFFPRAGEGENPPGSSFAGRLARVLGVSPGGQEGGGRSPRGASESFGSGRQSKAKMGPGGGRAGQSPSRLRTTGDQVSSSRPMSSPEPGTATPVDDADGERWTEDPWPPDGDVRLHGVGSPDSSPQAAGRLRVSTGPGGWSLHVVPAAAGGGEGVADDDVGSMSPRGGASRAPSRGSASPVAGAAKPAGFFPGWLQLLAGGTPGPQPQQEEGQGVSRASEHMLDEPGHPGEATGQDEPQSPRSRAPSRRVTASKDRLEAVQQRSEGAGGGLLQAKLGKYLTKRPEAGSLSIDPGPSNGFWNAVATAAVGDRPSNRGRSLLAQTLNVKVPTTPMAGADGFPTLGSSMDDFRLRYDSDFQEFDLEAEVDSPAQTILGGNVDGDAAEDVTGALGMIWPGAHGDAADSAGRWGPEENLDAPPSNHNMRRGGILSARRGPQGSFLVVNFGTGRRKPSSALLEPLFMGWERERSPERLRVGSPEKTAREEEVARQKRTASPMRGLPATNAAAAAAAGAAPPAPASGSTSKASVPADAASRTAAVVAHAAAAASAPQRRREQLATLLEKAAGAPDGGKVRDQEAAQAAAEFLGLSVVHKGGGNVPAAVASRRMPEDGPLVVPSQTQRWLVNDGPLPSGRSVASAASATSRRGDSARRSQATTPRPQSGLSVGTGAPAPMADASDLDVPLAGLLASTRAPTPAWLRGVVDRAAVAASPQYETPFADVAEEDPWMLDAEMTPTPPPLFDLGAAARPRSSQASYLSRSGGTTPLLAGGGLVGMAGRHSSTPQPHSARLSEWRDHLRRRGFDEEGEEEEEERRLPPPRPQSVASGAPPRPAPAVPRPFTANAHSARGPAPARGPSPASGRSRGRSPSPEGRAPLHPPRPRTAEPGELPGARGRGSAGQPSATGTPAAAPAGPPAPPPVASARAGASLSILAPQALAAAVAAKVAAQPAALPQQRAPVVPGGGRKGAETPTPGARLPPAATVAATAALDAAKAQKVLARGFAEQHIKMNQYMPTKAKGMPILHRTPLI